MKPFRNTALNTAARDDSPPVNTGGTDSVPWPTVGGWGLTDSSGRLRDAD